MAGIRVAMVGQKGHGKDTAAEAFITEGAYKLSFAEPIKEMLHVGLGIPMEVLDGNDAQKSEILSQFGVSSRRLMQTLGSEWGRELVSPTIWIDILTKKIQDLPEGSNIVVTDVRTVKEALALEEYGFTLIKVVRPDYGEAGTEGSNHSTETAISSIPCPYVLRNDGTIEELQRKFDRAVIHSRILAELLDF